MKTIAYFSRFLPSLQKGGGSRRTLQIAAMFPEKDIRLYSAPRGDGMEATRFQEIEDEVARFDPHSEWGASGVSMWSPQRRRGVFRLDMLSQEWAAQPELLSGISVALVDDPVYFPALIAALEEKDIPVMAICHNIESLSRDQVNEDLRMRLFERELGLLKKSALVVTISKEEDWLLNNLGIPSYFLSYFPVDRIKRRMDDIGLSRRHTEKHGFLVLGTAHNIQTRMGMERLIRFWLDNRLAQKYGRLLVAGFGTESIAAAGESESGIERLGSLQDDDLDELLTKIKACVCYQDGGAGALTRIPELLLARIPILANRYAARTYSGTPGIIEFNNIEELPALLESINFGTLDISTLAPPNFTALRSEIERFLR